MIKNPLSRISFKLLDNDSNSLFVQPQIPVLEQNVDVTLPKVTMRLVRLQLDSTGIAVGCSVVAHRLLRNLDRGVETEA